MLLPISRFSPFLLLDGGAKPEAGGLKSRSLGGCTTSSIVSSKLFLGAVGTKPREEPLLPPVSADIA